MELIVFACIVALIILVYLDYVISSFFAQAAEEKGYNEKKYFWISFWFGIVGYLLVIALPDKHARPGVVRPHPMDSVPTSQSASKTVTISSSPKAQAAKTEQITSPITKEVEPITPKEPCPHCGEDIEFMGFSSDDIKNGDALCPFCNKAI